MTIDAARPLRGLKVVEQGSFITGPFAAMQLADLGADVIKIERPGVGDPFRTYDGTLYSPTFRAFNRGKRSVTIDNTDPADHAAMRGLLAEADVYIHNFRPGVARRLGLDADAVRERNPRLIYCAISGFGDSGPYRLRPAYDTVAQAMTGMLSLTLDPAVPRISGPAIADAVTGLYAAQGILAALSDRAVTGSGRVVEVSMVEAITSFLVEPFTAYFADDASPGPYGRAAISQSYALHTADGSRVALHLSSPEKFWRSLLAATGRGDLAEDPRFGTRADRVRHHEELRAELQATFATRRRAHWLEALAAHDVPHAPVYELPEVLADPHIEHLDLVAELEHSREGRHRTIRPPLRFDGQRAPDPTAPPTLGEHDRGFREAPAWRTDANADPQHSVEEHAP
ncbi:CaiB/BaiF CoA transferase family protein [Spirillospora sp. CA-255316]